MSVLTEAFAIRGIRDAKVWPVLDLAAGTLGTICDVPAITQVSLKPDVAKKPMKGRAGTRRIRTKLLGGRGQILHATMSHDAIQAILGATNMTGVDYRTSTWNCGDELPTFKLEAQACQLITSTGPISGDWHFIVERCVVSDFSFSSQDESFLTATLQYDAFPSSTGQVFQILTNTEATDIV